MNGAERSRKQDRRGEPAAASAAFRAQKIFVKEKKENEMCIRDRVKSVADGAREAGLKF